MDLALMEQEIEKKARGPQLPLDLAMMELGDDAIDPFKEEPKKRRARAGGEDTLSKSRHPGSAADDRDQSRPAKPSEQRTGSERNRPGSAGRGGGKIEVGEQTERALRNKVEEHNEKHGEKKGKRVTFRMLAAVYRRGAGAFSVSHRPGMTRAQWAFARVNHFLHLVRTGKPKDPKYITDNDLLPKGHRRRTEKAHDEVDMSVPKAVIEELERGLKWHEEGHSGDGLRPETVAMATRMVNTGKISEDKARKMRAWLARHVTDLEGEGANPGEPGYPSPGRVAWALWGGHPAVPFSNALVEQLDRAMEEHKKESKMNSVELKIQGGALVVSKNDDGEEVVEMRVRFEPGSEGWSFLMSQTEKSEEVDGLDLDTKKATPEFEDLPLVDPPTTPWDGDAAEMAVREWAADGESIDWEKYRRAFFYFDQEDPEKLGSYKLGFATVQDGRLKAVPRGIFAAAAALQGARGGVIIPDEDRPAVEDHVSRYYDKMDREPPFEKSKSVVVPILQKRDSQQIVTGVVLVPNKVDAQGDIISPEAIERAAFDFAQRYGKDSQIGYMHKDFGRDLRMIESYIAPADMNLDGYKVPKGSWVMSVKVIDKEVWSRVKRNEIRGFSIGGVAQTVREIQS